MAGIIRKFFFSIKHEFSLRTLSKWEDGLFIFDLTCRPSHETG